MAKNEVLIKFTMDVDGARVAVGEFDEVLKSTAEEAGNVTKFVGALDAEIKKQSNTAANSVKNLKKLRAGLVSVAESVDVNSKEFEHLRTQIMQIDAELKKASASQGSFSTTAGRSGAALTEFGRIIADAPYGIQGVANNIEQFSQQFVDLTRETGSVGSAVKSLVKSFLGAGGIVIAIQLASAAYQILSKYIQDTNKGMLETAKAGAGAATNLRILRQALLDGNVSEEERVELLERANEEYDDLNLSLEDSEEATRKNIRALDDMIAVMAEAAKTRALQNLIEEEFQKQAELQVNESIRQQKWYGGLQKAFQYAAENTIGIAMSFEGRMIESGQRMSEYMSLIEDMLSLFDRPNEEKDKANKILELQEELMLMRIKFERTRLEVELELIAEKLAKEKKGTEEYIRLQIRAQGIVDKLNDLDVKDFEEKENEKQRISDLQQKLFEARLSDNEKLQRKHVRSEIAAIETILKSGTISAEKRAELELELYELRQQNAKMAQEDAESYAESAQKALSIVDDVLSARADREIAIEQNKTNALNDQLKKRLANEQLSAEERDKINQQIARNEAALVERENAINKKRFEQQKALQIAQALVETYRSAFLAYGSQLVIGDPTSPLRAQIAQAVALAAGLANVAIIARQQFTGKPMPAPTLSAQGGAIQSAAPAFNVVGASQTNQLAQAIAMSEQEPLKAYVVASDVTSAQELDRKIIEGASI